MYEGLPIIQATPEVLKVIVNETKVRHSAVRIRARRQAYNTQFWGPALENKSALSLSYSVELFLPTLYSHNTEKTAFPPVRNIPFQPFNLAFSWNSSEFDRDFNSAMLTSATHVKQKAIALGQEQLKNAPTYPNYAALGTPLQEMYGANIPALRQLKSRIDPDNVMSLAGGWKF